MLLGFKNYNNGQKFYIISFVSSFNRDYFSQKVGYWVLLTKIRYIWIWIIWRCDRV